MSQSFSGVSFVLFRMKYIAKCIILYEKCKCKVTFPEERRKNTKGICWLSDCILSRTGADVQWRECTGEPPPGRRLQAPPELRLWYIHQPQQEAEADATEDGHWHGKL